MTDAGRHRKASSRTPTRHPSPANPEIDARWPSPATPLGPI